MGALFDTKKPTVTPAPPAPNRTDTQTQELAAEQRRRMATGEQSNNDLGTSGGVTGFAARFLGGGR